MEKGPEKEMEDEINRLARDVARDEDMARSRQNPGYVDPLPNEVAKALVQDVYDLLATDKIRSAEELKFLITKLESALAIHYDKDTAELLKKLGDDYASRQQDH